MDEKIILNDYDYIGEKEITVCITLAEYRQLVGENTAAKYEIEKRDREIATLKTEIILPEDDTE